MIDDDRSAPSSSEDETLRRSGSAPAATGEHSSDAPLDRLPPPAFPPGHRRAWVHRPRPDSSALQDPGGGGSIPPDALYAPDAPIRRMEDPGEMGQAGPGSGDPIRGPAPDSLSPDDVADLLMELAREVRNGRTGRLLWNPAASPLEGAIRGLLSGYLRYPGKGTERA
jgi:hypothetical protein